MRKIHHRFRAFFLWMGLSQDKMALLLNCGQTTVHNLLTGAHGASVVLAVAIERLSADWPEGPILVEEWAEREGMDPK